MAPAADAASEEVGEATAAAATTAAASVGMEVDRKVMSLSLAARSASLKYKIQDQITTGRKKYQEKKILIYSSFFC